MMPDWLAHRARISPHRLAVICGDEQFSYRALDAEAGRLAAALRAQGVEPGDAVALHCGNGVPFALLGHAIPRAGAVLVPLNTRLAPDEIRFQLRDVGARLLLHDTAHADLAARVGSWSEGSSTAGVESIIEVSRALGPLEPGRLDLAATRAVIYTSGTTGTPKGAILTHGNFWYSAIGSALNLGLLAHDRWLAVLPLFHVGGLSILYRSAIYGTAAIIHDRFDAGRVNHAIDEDGVTIVSVVSTMLQRMLDERGDRPYPPSFRCALLGGGPAPLSLLERCASLGLPVVQTYGLTETTSQAATLAPQEALARLGSAGKPLMTAEVRIAEGSDPGEILVRGPIVSPGYVNALTDGTRDEDGWLHTGDMGYLDGEGYLYVLDRRSDLIVTGGENVYPAEIEAVLVAHPDVEEAGVCPVPDDEWGQIVVAAVVPKSGTGIDTAGVLAFCRQRLAGYKLPRRIIIVNELPRNAAGKLLRAALRERIS